MTVLDTSALVRFFTNDIPEKAQKVKKLIDTKEVIQIPDAVFPELEYVLMGKTYNTDRAKVATAFQFLVSQKTIIVSKAVRLAVILYKKTSLDMADCIIAASSYDHDLLSFDEELMKLNDSFRAEK